MKKEAIGFIVGMLLVAVLLSGWFFVAGAAGWFAPFFAVIGVGGLWLHRLSVGKNDFITGLGRTVGWVSLTLALAAAFSLGAFLPAVVAEFGSPVLGKWGGVIALVIIAIGIAPLAMRQIWQERKHGLADIVLFCTVAAIWLSDQLPRQAVFPQLPSNADLWQTRLSMLTAWAVIAYLAGLTFSIISRRKPIPDAGLARPASTDDFPTEQLKTLGHFSLSWAALFATFGLAVSLLFILLLKDFASAGQYWFVFAIVLALAILTGIWQLGNPLGGLAWTVLLFVITVLAFAASTEDLELVIARNTGERYAQQFWRGLVGDERFASRPLGTISGSVSRTAGTPLPDATVVVASVGGQTYTTQTDQAGRFTLSGVPVGNYIPTAIKAGFEPGPTPDLAPTRVVTVRQGQSAGGVDLQLTEKSPLYLKSNNSPRITATGVITRDNPELSVAQRSTFQFDNLGQTLKGGLIHEPPAEMGAGPFPVLYVVFPGPATSWEGVSVPLAAKGYVVVSYFPERIFNFAADMEDLFQIYKFIVDNKLSSRADGKRVAILGGSVSTVYTYEMMRMMRGETFQSNVKALVNYGGLFDMYRFRQNWEEGQVIIDPGISELEFLLVGLGRPDTRPEPYARFSPRFRTDRQTLPPTYLVHVNKDIIVPVEQTQIAQRVLTDINQPLETTYYSELAHYLDMSKRDPAYSDMLYRTIAFLDKYLKG
jgi:acetyl esterase/lipase